MERDQLTLFEDNAEYDAFVDKFKPKKTTDDCYTPEPVYQAAAMWVANEYGVDPTKFVRPFYPELDFMTYKYPEGCIVVDNPPFSLLSGIVRFYTARGIRFFLFAPALTLFTAPECPVCYLGVGADIVYENGAVVATSFVTNMDKYRLRTAPELRRAVQEASNEALRMRRGGANAVPPKYTYPDEVLTAAAMQRLSRYGAELNILPEQAAHVRVLDAQRERGKAIFGGGFLLTHTATEKRVAAGMVADKTAEIEKNTIDRDTDAVWELSERERALLAGMEGQANGASLF